MRPRRLLITGVLVALTPLSACDAGTSGPRKEPSATPSIPRCEPSPRSVAFTRVPLLPAPASGALVMTATILGGDLDGDGRTDLFVSEPLDGRLTSLATCGADICASTTPWSTGLMQPVRAVVTDLDSDGLRDVVVSDIGSLWPTNATVGRVMWLRNDSTTWVPQVVLDGVGRVACAEPGDVDGDEDVDLVTCVFGNSTGELAWLEHAPGQGFAAHTLRASAGSIHAFPRDFDRDGDLDVAAVFAQDLQTVFLYRGDGHGGFAEEVVFAAGEPDYGMSGIEPADVDSDGDLDLLLTNGDYFDEANPDPIALGAVHGLAWLENDGHGVFARHDVMRVLGAYATRAGDLDGDCDVDLVLGTLRIGSLLPAGTDLAPELFWLENLGDSAFAPHVVTDAPRHPAALELVDFDVDGRLDLVVGSFPAAEYSGPSDVRAVLLHAEP